MSDDISFLVDFNELDDDGILSAFASTNALKGRKVHMYDDDGNACIGEIVSCTGRLVKVCPDFSYWMPASPEFAAHE
jgi:hypothetical protein